ncbi:MAG: PAS domain-containing protein, partial [Clostridiaceae bacterium]|nr:PAS domain-containing protein [Clostridiaceae bacterium]
MKYSLKNAIKQSFFLLKNNILTGMNKEFIDLTGFTMEELSGKSIEEIGSMLRINSQVLFQNNPQNWISYIFTKTSEVKEVSISCRVENRENEKIYYFKVNRNSPFKERFQYLEYLLEDNKIGVAICSIPDLVLLRANEKFLGSQKFINDSVENNIGKPLKNSVNRFEGSKAEEIFKETIRTGKVYYDEEVKSDSIERGITYWDSTIIPIFIDGKAKYLIETVLEVTERVLNRNVIEKQSKEIQKQNEFIEKQGKQMQSIIEGLGEEILIVDKNGTYVGISDLINNRITGMGKNHKEIYREMEFYDLEGNIIPLEETCTSKALRGEKVKNLRTKIVCDGKTRYIDNTSIPIFNKEDELQFVISITHDITAEIISNEIMQKTLKSEEEFLVNISHELKTPLNVIYSTLQLFNMHCRNGSLDEKKESIYRYTNSMMQNCHRLSKLINNIVDLSKIDAGFLELTLSNNNIVGIVEEIVTSVIDYTDIKGLSIIFDTNIEEKIIACDPEKIERI